MAAISGDLRHPNDRMESAADARVMTRHSAVTLSCDHLVLELHEDEH